MKKKKLTSLSTHNKNRHDRDRYYFTNEPQLNGISCPECETELFDSDPMSTLTSCPPQKNVHCNNCGYRGYRIA